MKKKLLPLLCLLSFAAITNAQWAYLKYPSYSNVLIYFFRQYSVKDIENTDQLKFQKKPDGWHVVYLNMMQDSTISDQLLWSRDKAAFVNVRFNPAQTAKENDAIMAKLLNAWQGRWYNLFPYYNYPGWEWDVIHDYKDVKNLPDSMLYALGRSYSYATNNLLNNNSGMADKKRMFKLQEGVNCLSPEQLATYNKYHNLAIETYKAVQKLNPDFETIIGNIGIKLADEYMVGYLDMMIYQNEKEANKELKDATFTDFMVSMAKNYLMTCDSNAILFTDGDNDTFPLLFVQAKLKYRRDVLVVNLELLGTVRYANRMRAAFMDAAPLPLTFTQDEVKDGVRDYAYIIDRTKDDYIELKSALDFDRSQNPNDKISVQAGQTINYIPSHKLFFIHGSDKMEWTLPGQYLLRSNLLMLDALVTNNWKRPVYFGSMTGSAVYLGLDRYLEMQGFTYKIVSTKNPSANAEASGMAMSVNTHIVYDNLMNKYSWKGADSLVSAERLIAMDYRIFFSTLAQSLMHNNQNDSALKVLDRCIELFPNEKLKYDQSMFQCISSYYDIGQTAKADAIANTFIYNLHHNINNESGTMVLDDKTKNAIHTDLEKLLKKNHRTELLNKLEETQ